ncbi:MAG: LacI family transcriptional regulator [Lachnospiraceae bacterium]|nr:LacI family transcriptional regulator [Lachnospiraceae bacterium]
MSTLKKIAEITGVSLSTVSRVLNDPDYRCSSPAKRDRIWKAAMELKYVPNKAAKNLKKGIGNKGEKTYYIGVIVTRAETFETDPFFSELLHVIETEVHRSFCILSKVWYKPVLSDKKRCKRENLDKILSDMENETDVEINGVIVIGNCTGQALACIQKHFKNVVSINGNPSDFLVDEVVCDGEKVASIAVEYLLTLGHTEIGYVGECQEEARFRGYLNTLKKHGIEFNPSLVYETKQTEARDFEVMDRILGSESIPTALYCANDILAVGLLKNLARSQNRYFHISVVSSDDIEQAQFTKPMLSTVSLPKTDMGRFAMMLLLDRINGKHSDKVKIELNGKLVRRESCRNVQDLIDYYI